VRARLFLIVDDHSRLLVGAGLPAEDALAFDEAGGRSVRWLVSL
jgi:hypothetical protein